MFLSSNHNRKIRRRQSFFTNICYTMPEMRLTMNITLLFWQ